MPRNDERDLALRWSGRLSLTQRILAVNIFALLILAGSFFYLDSYRNRATEDRLRQMRMEAQLIAAGADPTRMLIAEVDAYPAHLHIDLLPALQGQGFGRRLIDTLRAALAARGVPAVHLGLDPANTAARAFYDRLGFHELPSSRPHAPLLGIATS